MPPRSAPLPEPALVTKNVMPDCCAAAEPAAAIKASAVNAANLPIAFMVPPVRRGAPVDAPHDAASIARAACAGPCEAGGSANCDRLVNDREDDRGKTA